MGTVRFCRAGGLGTFIRHRKFQVTAEITWKRQRIFVQIGEHGKFSDITKINNVERHYNLILCDMNNSVKGGFLCFMDLGLDLFLHQEIESLHLVIGRSNLLFPLGW